MQQEEENKRRLHTSCQIAANRKQILTNNINVGVGEDGSVFIRGLTLVDCSVSKDDIF